MDVKEAVQIALQYVKELFGDEKITNLGLEEAVRSGTTWQVTVGFSRPWNYPKKHPFMVDMSTGSPARDYKIVEVDGDDGSVISVVNREGAS